MDPHGIDTRTHRAWALLGSALLLSGLAACGEPPGPSGMPGDLPVLQLSSEPTRQIGMIEGDSDYVFGSVAAVRHVPGGNLWVSDPMANEILIYDPDGKFVRRVGGRGGGPGEFRSLSHLYVTDTDSVLALDGAGRISVFDTAGDFVHQVDPESLSDDSLFTMDVWLYGRYWVEGALTATERSRVRAILDGLPPPVTDAGYRYVRVDTDGRLWIREPRVSAGNSRMWTLIDDSGSPSGSLAIPMPFDPQEIRGHEITGRWLGENDVSFVRTYTFGETGQVRATPTWLTEAPPPPVPPTDQQEFLAAVRGQLKRMASAEEIHYSKAFTYTDQLDSLSAYEPDPEVHADIVQADARGWAGVFSHPSLDRICGLAYGLTIPPGWLPGRVICGPPARADSTSTDPS